MINFRHQTGELARFNILLDQDLINRAIYPRTKGGQGELGLSGEIRYLLNLSW
jgi:hypothetical protein